MSWGWPSVLTLLWISAWGGVASGRQCLGSTLGLYSGGTRPHHLAPVSPGRWVFPFHVRLLIGSEYAVDLMEEVPEHLAPLLGASLDDGNEVVHLDIDVFCGVRALLRR